MATVGLDIKDIKGPEDDKNYYHTDGLGDIWVDGKGHPIELTVPLQGQQVQSVSPETLWHGRQTRHMTHTDTTIPTIPMSATNSTMVNPGRPNTLGNIPVSPIIDRQIGNTTVDMTDERHLFNVHSGITQTALQTIQNKINDPQTHPSQVKKATKSMNEMQKEISHKLIPILEESPKDDHTEELENSEPEDLASQNNHVKELTEKDRLIQEGRQQAILEMSQIAQNLQDHMHMQIQNLHQSYEQKIQSLTLDCDRQIQKLQSKYDRDMQNQKEQLKSQKQFYKAQRQRSHNSARYPPVPDISVPPPPQFHNTFDQNASIMSQLNNTQLELSNSIKQNAILTTQHYLSMAPSSDGKDPKQFHHWLDEAIRLAHQYNMPYSTVVSVTSRGSVHRCVKELIS